MKKTSFLTAALAVMTLLGAGVAEAYSEFADVDERPYSVSNQMSVQQKLNEAINRRYNLYYTKHLRRNGLEKNRLFKQARHLSKVAESNVDMRSTKMNRSGELRTVPTYDERRERTTGNYYRGNWKQVWRRCAINYYVEGGNCDVEAKKDNVVYGSTHRVNRTPTVIWNRDGEAVNRVRAAQRNLGSPTRTELGAAQQRSRAHGLNNYAAPKRFMHPFMYNEQPEANPADFFSTEDPSN